MKETETGRGRETETVRGRETETDRQRDRKQQKDATFVPFDSYFKPEF